MAGDVEAAGSPGGGAEEDGGESDQGSRRRRVRCCSYSRRAAPDSGRVAVGTVLAVFFVAVIVNGVVLAGTSDRVQSFDGVALLGAVTLSIVAQRRKVPNRT